MLIHCQRFAVMLMLFGSIFCFHPVLAEDDEQEELAPGSKYVEIEPVFITNYGGTTRLAYMKIEITLRVVGDEGEQQVMHHMPAIRDTLLNLFAIQTNDTIHSATGKENLRKQSFEVVVKLLEKEDKKSHLEDLLFTSFVVQR